jgi:hypothetical protein
METHDFVREYVELLSKITDAPEEFQEAAALFLLSTAVGRKWVFQSIPETSIFGSQGNGSGRLLNLWFIIIGKSRIGRKTSGVLKHVTELVGNTIGERMIITEVFTPEALLKQIAQKSRRFEKEDFGTPCCWICDEISWLFQQLAKKESYMANADAFLSKIYDGENYSRETIGRDKEQVLKPYLTAFAGSTDYLPTYFNESVIRLGFINRFIFVIGERKERKPLRTEPLIEEEKKAVKEIEDFLKVLVEKTSITVIQLSDEAKKLYDDFEKEIENQIMNAKLGIKESYCGQLPNLVVRLSCLYRISRMVIEEIRSFNSTFLMVEKQDIERAIGYSWKTWAWFEKVIEIMLVPRGKSVSKESQTEIGRQLVLQRLREGPASRAELLEVVLKPGIGHSMLDNLIITSLLRDNLIKRDESVFGRYYLVEHKSSPSNQ